MKTYTCYITNVKDVLYNADTRTCFIEKSSIIIILSQSYRFVQGTESLSGVVKSAKNIQAAVLLQRGTHVGDLPQRVLCIVVGIDMFHVYLHRVGGCFQNEKSWYGKGCRGSSPLPN